MVTTHSKGNKDQSRKQQNLKGTYRGAKTHEGNRVSYPSYIHGPKTFKKATKLERHLSGSKDSRRKPCCIPHTFMGPSIQGRTQRVTRSYHAYRIVLYPSYIHGPLHTGKNSKELRRLPRLSNTLRKPLARRTLKG